MKQHTHIGVYALITKNDKILLIKKSRGPYIGKWDLPGGSLEFGEDILEGLSREVLEETGLYVLKSDLMNTLSCTVNYKKNEKMHHIGIIYKVTLNESKGKLKTDSDDEDSNGAEWVKLSDINKNNSSPFANQSI